MKNVGTSGRLSFIFPGLSNYPCLPPPDNDGVIQSRVCEQIWLENPLFGIESDTNAVNSGTIVLLFEEFYSVLTSLMKRDISPGSLGEQIVVRELDPALLTEGTRLSIGDAEIVILQAPDINLVDNLFSMPPEQLLKQLPHCRVSISDEGLIEPGSPVTIINK